MKKTTPAVDVEVGEVEVEEPLLVFVLALLEVGLGVGTKQVLTVQLTQPTSSHCP